MTQKKTNEQLELWPKDNVNPTVADECLRHFGEEYIKHAQEIPGDIPLIVEADIFSLACLFICATHYKKLSPTKLNILSKCKGVASLRGTAGLYDHYPWNLAIEIVSGYQNGNSEIFKGFMKNLNHPDSDVRSYMILIGWILRYWLPMKSVIPRLLENVANALDAWWESAGLCYSMFDSFEEFQDYISHYRGKGNWNADQYRERIETIRANGVAFCVTELYEKENDICFLVEDYAMGLRCA